MENEPKTIIKEFEDSTKRQSEAKDNINATDKDKIKYYLRALNAYRIDSEQVYNLFYDWQSKRTVALKRWLYSLSTMVIAAWWMNVDYSKLSILGVQPAESSELKFLSLLLIIIFSASIFFYISLNTDASVNKEKYRSQEAKLKTIKTVALNFQKILNQAGIEDIFILFRSPKMTNLHESSEEHIDKTYKSALLFDRLEPKKKSLERILALEILWLLFSSLASIAILLSAILPELARIMTD